MTTLYVILLDMEWRPYLVGSLCAKGIAKCVAQMVFSWGMIFLFFFKLFLSYQCVGNLISRRKEERSSLSLSFSSCVLWFVLSIFTWSGGLRKPPSLSCSKRKRHEFSVVQYILYEAYLPKICPYYHLWVLR